VVIDPVAREVTHLVVEPEHRSGLGRLVPLRLVESTIGDIHLSCTRAEVEKLDQAEETLFMPGGLGAFGDYSQGQTLAWPYYGLVRAEMGGNITLPVIRETLPVGEVEVQRGSQVHSTDGEIGKVEGLVLDRASHHVTHVLLQEGHIWGKRQFAIPIASVSKVDERGVWLGLTKEQVADLPPVGVENSRL
jgi:sporulation protein YlmC with PRC-barrel domain